MKKSSSRRACHKGLSSWVRCWCSPRRWPWAVFPFTERLVLANINAGVLYIMAITSMGVYGVVVAGWASNSKYAFLGALRSSAQIVSYEIAMGFALVGVLMCAAEP